MERSVPAAKLGNVCVALGLVTPEALAGAVAVHAQDPRGRFADLLLAMGLLDDEGLAWAFAHQNDLNHLPTSRIQRLPLPADLLALLPAGLIQDRLIVPFQLDAEASILSVLVADPGDLAGLRAARTAAGVTRLRLFVGSRTALRQRVTHVLGEIPTFTGADAAGLHARPTAGTSLLYEPDQRLAAPLRKIEQAEHSTTEVVTDLDQVPAFIEGNNVTRVFFRRIFLAAVASRTDAWRRFQPDLQTCPVERWGDRHGVPHAEIRDFFLGMLEFALLVRSGAPAKVRHQVRRQARLVRDLAVELNLPPERREAVQVAALFADISDVADGAAGNSARYQLPWTVLDPYAPPWDLNALFERLARRTAEREPAGADLAVEILYTARAAVRENVAETADPLDSFGAQAARHDGRVVRALIGVLRREALRQRVAAGGATSASILFAAAAPERQARVESRLAKAGFDVSVTMDSSAVVPLARQRLPAAVLIDQHVVPRDGFATLLDLRRDRATRAIPVIFLLDGDDPTELTRAFELGAADVLEEHFDPEELAGRLRRAIEPPFGEAAPIAGRLEELSVGDLVRTVALGGSTAILEINGMAGPGRIQIRGGRVVAAWRGTELDADGQAALQTLTEVREGTFDLRFVDTGHNNLPGGDEFPTPNHRRPPS